MSADDAAFRILVNGLADELCRSVDGRFDFRVDIASEDPDFQKLRMLVNSTLDTARRGIESIAAEKEREGNERRLIAERDQAEAQAKMRSEFLANMSHEIRTPMHGILGMCELLMDTPLSDPQEKLLSSLLESARSLLRILNDVLDISKLEAGHVQVERIPFDLAELVDGVTDLKAVVAGQKKLAFHLETDDRIGPVVGDPHRLRQVLLNLLANAIKFTQTGQVRLKASLEDAETPLFPENAFLALEPAERTCRDGWLRFEVMDTGIGMSAEAQKHLFRKFSQLDPSISRRFGGSGLGLAITREIVRLMGGAITVESELHRGSSFSVWLPHRPTSDVPRKSGASLNGVEILVIDDNADNREIARATLQRYGASVTSCEDGFMGLAELEERLTLGLRLDLVLLDARMPVLDGKSVLERFRERCPGLKPPPVLVAISGEAAEEHWPEDVVGFITKPFDRARLLKQIETVLRAEPDGSEEARPAPVAQQFRPRLRVLLAEDNEINRMIAAKMLEGSVARLTMVEDGMEALEALSTGDFDLVLMDVQMPRMSGLDAIAAIRGTASRYRDVPVVALTANAMVTDRDRFLAAGFSDYLSKPYRRSDIEALLGKWTARLATTPETTEPSADEAGRPDADQVDFDDASFMNNFSVFDPEERAEILRQAQEQLEEETGKIRRAALEGDIPTIEAASHKLAGGLGAVGFVRVSTSARRLMTLAQAHGGEGMRPALEDFFAVAARASDLLSSGDALRRTMGRADG